MRLLNRTVSTRLELYWVSDKDPIALYKSQKDMIGHGFECRLNIPIVIQFTQHFPSTYIRGIQFVNVCFCDDDFVCSIRDVYLVLSSDVWRYDQTFSTPTEG